MGLGDLGSGLHPRHPGPQRRIFLRLRPATDVHSSTANSAAALCFHSASTAQNRQETSGLLASNSSNISIGKNGAPGKIRTPDPQIRSLVLYPAELPAPVSLAGARCVPVGEARKLAKGFGLGKRPDCAFLTLTANGPAAAETWGLFTATGPLKSLTLRGQPRGIRAPGWPARPLPGGQWRRFPARCRPDHWSRPQSG